MPPAGEQQNRIVGCAGRKGTGKSTKAKQILQAMAIFHPASIRLFIYDTMGEHHWCPDSFEELDHAVIYLMESFSYDSFVARYIPETDDEEADFSEICNVVYEQGNMTFLVEEVAMLGCSANHSPKKFKRLMRLGRHRNVDMLYTTQRLEEIPVSLRSATDVFILFAHSEPRALDAIADRCGVEVMKKVEAFQGHEFLVYDVNAKKEVSTIDCGSIIVPISSLASQLQIA